MSFSIATFTALTTSSNRYEPRTRLASARSVSISAVRSQSRWPLKPRRTNTSQPALVSTTKPSDHWSSDDSNWPHLFSFKSCLIWPMPKMWRFSGKFFANWPPSDQWVSDALFRCRKWVGDVNSLPMIKLKTVRKAWEVFFKEIKHFWNFKESLFRFLVQTTNDISLLELKIYWEREKRAADRWWMVQNAKRTKSSRFIWCKWKTNG